MEAGMLVLPESKTGAKKVHVNKSAVEILNALPRPPAGWVIPGRLEGKRMINLQKPWDRIRKRAKLEDVRIHDLRHSFASVGVSLNLGLPKIGKLLGHSQAETTNRYAHLATDPARQAAEQIGAAIEHLMTGGAKVIEIGINRNESKAQND